MPESNQLSINVAPSTGALRFDGTVTIDHAGKICAALDAIPSGSETVLDLSGLSRIDTAGAYLLLSATRKAEQNGGAVRIEGAGPQTERLLARLRNDSIAPVDNVTHRATISVHLENLGRAVSGSGLGAVECLGILGLFFARLARAVVRPREFRLTSLVHHIQEVGLKAVPIVALMAFLIGVVLAFQGSAQLRQFGAEVFVVDLIAISILRELGILLTAIIVAGRTASAFTAAIGSMKMREEIDAMRTLAIDPAQALIVPRVLALLISLPILGLVANFAGLLGGALMSWIELSISPDMFRTRLLEGTDIRHVWVGLVKAPVFAIIIGVIGCWAGLKVERDAESLGRMTSSAVVAAIFAVIVADAAFSIFFAQLGI